MSHFELSDYDILFCADFARFKACANYYLL